MPTQPSKSLQVVPNPHPDVHYEVEMVCPEFTCVCPMTGQPDFATFTITYVPGPKIVELKSLKLYLWSFRDEGHFHEDVTNMVLKDLVAALDPREMCIDAQFNVRGGITTTVRTRYPDRTS
jgi:7-cyano-7-deazaguanine reductase